MQRTWLSLLLVFGVALAQIPAVPGHAEIAVPILPGQPATDPAMAPRPQTPAQPQTPTRPPVQFGPTPYGTVSPLGENGVLVTGPRTGQAPATVRTAASQLAGSAGSAVAPTPPEWPRPPFLPSPPPGSQASPDRHIQDLTPRRPAAVSPASTGYAVTLTQDIFTPDTPITLTATLTDGGVPVAGATIAVGWNAQYGSFTTDANGVATISLRTPGWGAVMPLSVTTAAASQMPLLKAIYSVPAGCGVIVVDGVTDRQGAAVRWYQAMLSYFSPLGGSFTWLTGSNDGWSAAVHPAGINYMEMFVDQGNSGLFLHQVVNVPDRAKLTLTPSAAGTVRLQASATVDGAAAASTPRLWLHNTGMPDTSMLWDDNVSLPPDAYVTPGTYTVVLASDDPALPYRLERSNVSVQADTAVTFAESSASLASLRVRGFDGRGAEVPGAMAKLQMGDIGVDVNAGLTYRATPGVAYRPRFANFTIPGPNNTTWSYIIDSGDRAPVTPAAGDLLTFDRGGPASLRLSPQGSAVPGGYLWVDTGILTAAGDRIYPRSNSGVEAQGTLALTDSAGNVVASMLVHPNDVSDRLPIPGTASGSYKLSLDWDTGPYQGMLHAEQTVYVGRPYTLTLSREILDPGASVSITATLTSADGTPAAGLDILAGQSGEYGSFTTDATGHAAIVFQGPNGDHVVPLYVRRPDGSRVRVGQLFVLSPGRGGVVIDRVTGRSGESLWDFSAAVYETGGGQWQWGGQAENGLLALIAPAGANYLKVEYTAGSPGLSLHSNVAVPDRDKLVLTPSGAGTVHLTASASFDGVGAGGFLAIRSDLSGSVVPNSQWLWPDVYVTPGVYSAAFMSTDPAHPFLLYRSGLNLQSDTTLTFAEATGGLATLQTPGEDGHGNPVRIDTWVAVESMEVWLPTGLDYRVTPNITLRPRGGGLSLTGSGGSSWYVSFNSVNRAPLTTAAGATGALHWGGPVAARTQAVSPCFEQGCTVTVDPGLYTADGDRVGIYHDGHPVAGTLSLRDPGGSLLMSRPTYTYWDRDSITLPAAPGTYTVSLDYDLGPYQGAVHAEYAVAPAPNPYAVTFASDILAPNSDVAVVATVTKDGAPLAGARVRVDPYGGSFTTDAGGKATLAFHTHNWLEQLGVYLTADGLTNLKVGELYVLSPGYGVIVADGLTDQSGASVTNYQYQIYHWGQNGSWTTTRPADHGRASAIMPVGAAQAEFLADRGGAGLFLYQTVDVPDRAKIVLHPDGSQTVHLTVSASLDGTPLPGTLQLHNEAMGSVPSWYATLPPDSYVTPGTYSLLFNSTDTARPALLYRSRVGASAETAVALTETTTGLAWLRVRGEDGHGVSLSFTGVLDTPGMMVPVSTQTDYLVTPGTQYRPALAWVGMYDANGIFRQMRLEGPNRPPFTPGAGSDTTIHWGGPLTAVFSPSGRCWDPGCQLGFAVGLTTADGDQLMGDNGVVSGLLALHDSTGAVVAQQQLWAWDRQASVQLPANAAGAYTVTLDYNLGPYQGPVHREISFTAGVNPFQLTLSREVLPTNSPAAVTATLVIGGAPVGGARIDVGDGPGYGSFTTGPDGKAILAFRTTSRLQEVPLYVSTDTLNHVRLASLWVVGPGYGVISVPRLTDRSGAPVTSDYTAAFYSYRPDGSLGPIVTTMASGGPVTEIMPAGPTYAEFMADEGTTGLFLLEQITVPDQAKLEVRPTAAGTVHLQATATLDGATVTGWLKPHNESLPGRSQNISNWWLPPDLWVTPGSYTLTLFSVLDQSRRLLLTRSGVDLGADAAVAFTATTAALATLRNHAADGNGSPLPLYITMGTPAITMAMRPGQDYLVSPDIPYQPLDASYSVQGADGSSWWYSLSGGHAPVTPQAGRTSVIEWGGKASPMLAPTAICFQPGCRLLLMTGIQTAGGDRLWVSHGNSSFTGTLALRDAAGKTVQSVPVQQGSGALDIPSDAAGLYTATLDYDIGPYQGAIHAEYSFTAGVNPYALQLSNDVLPVGADAVVTATFTKNGQPVAGARVEVNGGQLGSFLTDANGVATLSFHAPPENRYLYLNVTSDDLYRAQVGMLYAVSPGFGLLAVPNVTDRSGAPVGRFSAFWDQPAGGGGHSGGRQDAGSDGMAVIVPAGPGHAEFAARSGSTGLFLFQDFTVPSQGKVTLQPSGVGTTRLQVDASAVTAGAGRVYLNNAAMPVPTNLDGLPPETYVTPGVYTVAFAADEPAPSVLLARTGVDLSAGRVLTLTDDPAGMATIAHQGVDAAGNPLALTAQMAVEGAVVPMIGGRPYRVYPGLTYRPVSARFQLNGPDGQPWTYILRSNPGGHPPVTPATGASLTIRWGGPVSLLLQPANACTGPGCSVTLQYGLFTADGDRVLVAYPWGGMAWGVLTLRDGSGSTLLTQQVNPYLNQATIIVPPGAAGPFSATLDWDLGPYQGTAHAAVALGAGGGGLTERASVAGTGAQGDAASGQPAISADGRYVAFTSDADNLVPNDTNQSGDIFVRDRQSGAVERVSLSGAGAQGDRHSRSPSISADGRYVTFASDADNLVDGDTNGVTDIFVYDRQAHATERVSVSSAGAQADGPSQQPVISADGRYVAFTSDATNLVDGDTSGVADIFVYDRQTHGTVRVSIPRAGSGGAGAQADGPSTSPAISADGRYVAFASAADNLVAGDTNGLSDIFVYDRQTGGVRLVSLSATGAEGNGPSRFPSISADGTVVAFESDAHNLVPGDSSSVTHAYAADLQANALAMVTAHSLPGEPNGPGWMPVLSADGQSIAFTTLDARGLPDLVVWDRGSQTATRVSVSTWGAPGNGPSGGSGASLGYALSSDGRFVAFASLAANLVEGDTNNASDVFVRSNYGLGINGFAVAEGRPGPDPVTIVLLSSSRVYLTTTGEAGGFQIPGVADGTYTLTATRPGHLSRSVAVSVQNGALVTPTVPINLNLPYGDLNRDGVVDQHDLDLLAQLYRQNGSDADPAFEQMDRNHDGTIDLTDVFWVAWNYGQH